MLQIFLLVMGIAGLVKLPSILKSRPETFPGATPELFNKWRQKELVNIYVTLATGWGILGLGLLVAFGAGAAGMVRTDAQLNSVVLIVNGVSLILIIAGALWINSLTKAAKELKKQLMTPPAGGFYPRYGVDAGQATPMPPLENPDQSAP